MNDLDGLRLPGVLQVVEGEPLPGVGVVPLPTMTSCSHGPSVTVSTRLGPRIGDSGGGGAVTWGLGFVGTH